MALHAAVGLRGGAGMTAPRHARHVRHVRLAAVEDALAAAVLALVDAFAKWSKDRTGWEKTYAAVRASILLGMLIGALISLTGCRSEGEIPGHGTEPSAVRIADGIDLTPEQMAETLQVNPQGLAVLLSRSGR